MNNLDLVMTLIFRGAEKAVPPAEIRLRQAYDFACNLQAFGLPLARWLLKGNSLKDASKNRAFDDFGPSAEFIRTAADEENNVVVSSESVWNGARGRRASDFAIRFNLQGLCQIQLYAESFDELSSYSRLADLAEILLKQWPALVLQAAPYSYSSRKVFPNRPGVGWMLYLPKHIDMEQVPEARIIRHTTDLNGTAGSIIISVIDAPFDANNGEHVKAANAIEIRLADQGLLPRYIDL